MSGGAHYDRGLARLEEYMLEFSESVLTEAIGALREAVALDPEKAAHWMVLGHALDQAGDESATLEALRRAARLDPSNTTVEVFVLLLMAESGAEAEALEGVQAAAERQGVDLDALRRELEAAGAPVDARTLISNGFIHAPNYLRSWVWDEIEAMERRTRGEQRKRKRREERLECAERQEEILRGLDEAAVPHSLRGLIPWAIRLGIGDDVCRGLVFAGLTKAERAEVTRAVAEHAKRVYEWLDQAREPMSPSEAAFMYLLLAVEEATQE